ncbi:MAG: hypothetical protein C5B56_15680 [Proteobacteria bacterium]|nr:MAG: hypothetical protein C5B56_15680 [Pseudomonadota bacterium]
MSDDPAEDLRAHYEAGDKSALLRAVLYAAMFRRPLAEWAADAFKAAYECVERGGARSWDDVFGYPHPPGKQLRSIQLDALKYQVWSVVRAGAAKGMAIDEQLFEEVGNIFGIGKTKAGELYYEAKRALDISPPDVTETAKGQNADYLPDYWKDTSLLDPDGRPYPDGKLPPK